jgi:adenylate cyclase, class 2
VSTETEIKVKITDAGDFLRNLSSWNPQPLFPRHFEDNHLLDFADRRLRSNQCLLRIRFAEGKSILTYKGPPRPEGIFKVREELETAVENGSILLQTLERIGMTVCFRYQKYREEFAIDSVHVAVDETPIGDYVEFEGPENEIRKLTREMGIAEAQYVRASYYSLYLENCREKGEAPEFMVFK